EFESHVHHEKIPFLKKREFPHAKNLKQYFFWILRNWNLVLVLGTRDTNTRSNFWGSRRSIFQILGMRKFTFL
ncbi:MAG: hypothetical protein ABJJ43_00065, partial [Ekhidna sp.]